MRKLLPRPNGWAVLLGIGSVVGWVACSGTDRTFGNETPSSGGDNASAGGTQAEMPSEAGGSSEPIGEGGSASGDAGATSSSGAPALGGEGGGANAPACGTVYGDWFRATFPYPDGGILGVADFPSSPWRAISGTLTTQSGAARSSGNSLAVASQGKALDGVGTRARFKLGVAKAEQTVTMRMNADSDGTGGLAIRVAGDTGEVTVSVGDQALATEAFGALDVGTPYFVQVTLSEGSLAATLSTGNYAGVPGANELGTLVLDQLDTPTGTYAAIELNGTGTNIDDLSLAVCGASPPKYEALLRDTFTRASSASPGKPEIPATSTWASSLGNGAKVSIGANELLLSQGASIYTDQGQHYAGSGLRFRSSAKFASLGWFVLHFNAKADLGGGPLGFDLWRETDSNIFIEYSGATGSGRFPFALDVDSYYFLQFDVDGDTAVATMRSGSYEGPIMFGSYSAGLVDPPVAQKTLSVGNTWSSDLAITEVFVDQYAP